ncbi:LysR substrate-binding domain-containing protein [Actinoplanes sp. NPDC026619]|uniref:LysR family transcriptional regulator n=1 Tax=Actinoplanes sp. NPDC026619 TaxID=3155798 RepID=UPI0033E6EEAB
MIWHAFHEQNAWQNDVMSEFTLVGLRVVQEVAAAGSFTRAAEALGYTQSAVSRQVAAMEAAAGALIFERDRRGATPTPAGQVLLRHAAQVSAGVSAAELELAGMRDRLAGRMTVGAFPTANMALVPRAVAQVTAGHPGLAVIVKEAATPTLLRQLRAGRLDVAVIAVGHGLPDYDLGELAQHLLAHGRLLVAVPKAHRFAGQADVAVPDLFHEQWVVSEGAPGEPQFGAWPTVPEPRIAHTVRTWSTRLGLVAAGLGITVIPELILPAIPADVRAVPVRDSHWPGRATVAVTVARPSAQAQTLVAALQTQAVRLNGASAESHDGHGLRATAP